MTKREAISRVKKALKEIGADSRLTNKQVWGSIDSKSSLIISREADSLRLSRIQKLYQSIPCVKMEEVTQGDSCGEVTLYCSIIKSVEQLPEMYADTYGVIIDSINTIDRSIQIKLTTAKELLRIKKDTNSRFDKTIYAFFQDNYLYLSNAKYPLIEVRAMFKDDVRLRKTNKCGGQIINCLKFLDTDWVIPQKIEDDVLRLVIQDLASVYKKIPEDVNINKNPNN